MRTESPKNVLLIEDEPYWQFIVGESIRSFQNNVNVRCVRSVAQAEDVLMQTGEAYDLIISDHYLQGDQTGIDLWKKCQDHYENIPFLMISGLSENDFHALLEEELGTPLYLEKDLIPDELEFIWNTKFIEQKKSTSTDKNIFLTLILTIGIAGNLIAMGLNRQTHLIATPKTVPQITTQTGSSAEHNPVKDMITVETKQKLQHILSEADHITVSKQK